MKIIVKSNMAVLLLLGLATAITFHPVLSNGFMGDDSGQIVNNIYIRNIKNIPLFLRGGTFYVGGIDDKLFSDYYRPMMIIWYSVIYFLFGLNAFYFHLVQIFLHIVNGMLVYLIFRKFFSTKILPLLLSLIFLLHPIQTETVAYLATVQDLLFFFFGTLGLYILSQKKHSYKAMALTFILFFAALLSKEIAIICFVVSIVYIEIYKVPKKIYGLFWLGSTITVSIYISMRCFVAHICGLGGGGHSVVPIARMTMIERFKQIPAILLFYIKTFLFPKDLATFQYWIAKNNIEELYIPLIISLIFFFTFLSIPFYLYKKKDRLSPYLKQYWFGNKARVAKSYAFFLLWFFMGLLLYVNIIPLDSTVAERWFYFPLVGLLGVIGILIRMNQKHKILYVVLIPIIVLFSIRSYLRAKDWSDPYVLYSKDIKISKESASLENNYGAVLFEKGDYKNAEIHFRNAIRLAPQSPIYLSNLAQIYEKKKDYKNAEKYYLQSIKYGRFYVAFEKYADLLLKQGRKKEAVKFLQQNALPTFPFNQTLKNIYKSLRNQK